MEAIRRIGFIGLGRMGLPMSSNLLRAGYSVKGYDIAPARLAEFAASGGARAASPGDAARDVDLVISMILDDTVLAAVALADDGVLQGAAPGTVYADMSTVSPLASQRVAQAAAAREVPYLRAKVSGSVKPATEGTLTIFTSGPQDAYTRCAPVFQALGRQLYYVGPEDEAIYLKLVHNLIVGITSAMLGEALTFGERAGLDWRQMLDILGHSALSSPFLAYKVPLLQDRRYTPPQSTVDVAAKDIDLALTAAKQLNLPLPFTALAREMFRGMQARGEGELDFISIVRQFETLAGLTPIAADQDAPAGERI